MGFITFKRVKANYKNNPAIRNLLRYVIYEKGYEKEFKYWGARNLPKDVEKASHAIITLQKLLGSNNGRLMHQFVLSLPLEIQDVKVAYILAEALADYLGEEYQLYYGVHTDKPNLHVHVAMNSVSFKTGRKWHKDNPEFPKWSKKIIKMMEDVLGEYYSFKSR